MAVVLPPRLVILVNESCAHPFSKVPITRHEVTTQHSILLQAVNRAQPLRPAAVVVGQGNGSRQRGTSAGRKQQQGDKVAPGTKDDVLLCLELARGKARAYLPCMCCRSSCWQCLLVTGFMTMNPVHDSSCAQYHPL